MMTPSVNEMKKGTCGCGRSPTGDCIGWHGLSEDEFRQQLAIYEDAALAKAIAEETLTATDK